MKNYKIKRLRDKKADIINYYIEVFNTDFSLYRYRECNEYSLGSLFTDKFSFSAPVNFNDPYDVTVRIEKKKLIDSIKAYSKEIDFNNACRSLTFLFEKSDKFEMKINTIINYYTNVLMNVMKSSSLIACMSEKYDNEVMWAHYANSGKGFVLEYEYQTLLEARNDIVNKFEDAIAEFYKHNFELFETDYDNVSKMLSENSSVYGVVPVIYENGKYNATYLLTDVIKKELFYMSTLNIDDITSKIDFAYPKYILNYIKKSVKETEFSKSIAMNTTSLYMKKKDWKYEKEWRFVVPNTDGTLFNTFKSDFGLYAPLKPKSIILGEFISFDYEKMIVQIASEKGINIYKMKSDFSKSAPKLLRGRKYSSSKIKEILS